MASPNVAIGNEVALQLHPVSPSFASNSGTLSTVGQLLNAIDPHRPKHFPMLWSTVSHVSEMMNVVYSEMPIGMLRQALAEFDVWLKQRRYSPKSIATFQYNLRRLIEKSEELGLSADDRLLIDAWAPVSEALRKIRLAPRSLPGFAIAHGKTPGNFSSEDLDSWGVSRLARGKKHRTVRLQKGLFKRAVREAKLTHLFTKLDTSRRSDYGIRTDDMPEPLRSEVRGLLIWKQAKFVKGRPQSTRHRPVSARELEAVISRLYGFAVNIQSRTDVNSLAELFCEEIVGDYAEWAVNERNVTRGSLLRLSMIFGALRHHRDYKSYDYSWFSGLCDLFPEDDKESREARKALKKVSFETLSAVPAAIRASAPPERSTPQQVAWAAHDELLMLWLVTLPWRQRNLRECRISGGPHKNLFYAPLSAGQRIAKPNWAEELLNTNKDQPFWQFYFSTPETKTAHEARGILPRRLIGPLERYLEVHRPLLVSRDDPGSLFLNRDGGSLDRRTVTELVGNLTCSHTGVRVTPHIARDIFALAYLEAFPKDFLTLSKILFHRSVHYTISVYASDFNESNGARAVDEWLGA